MSRFHDFDGRLGLPEVVELEPTDSCNLRCRMCHVSFMPNEKRNLFNVDLVDQLAPLRGAFVAVASGFEPMIHPRFGDLLARLGDLEFRLQLITNGTHCDRDGIAALTAANLYAITFSFDGIAAETYEAIRRGSRHGETLDRILATRAAFAGRDTLFAVNSTTMRSNLDETSAIVDFWDAHDFDVIRFLLMVVRYADDGLVAQSLYPVRDKARAVFDAAARRLIEERRRIVMARLFHDRSPLKTRYPDNCDGEWVFSDHPGRRFIPNYRAVHQLGRHPDMPHWSCRSAFNVVSILANGDVQICYKYTVGNLHEEAFEDIWFGERADRARRTVVGDPADCLACDCFRFGIALRDIDHDRPESHVGHDFVPLLSTIDFEAGRFTVRAPPPPPRLIDTIGAYNIVHYDHRYIGVPHAAGAFEIDKADLAEIPDVVVEDSFAKARHRVRAIQEGPVRTIQEG